MPDPTLGQYVPEVGYLSSALALLAADEAPGGFRRPLRAAVLALAAIYERDLRTGAGADAIPAVSVACLLGWSTDYARRTLDACASAGLVDAHFHGYTPRDLGPDPDRRD